MYQHNRSLFLKSADKYRDRLCGSWNIYPEKDPDDLTAEEIYKGIMKFRHEKNLNMIYFFKYPPYIELDKRFRSLYKDSKLVRVNINNPELKGIIKKIHYGFINSDPSSNELTREYYESISIEDYFDHFDSNNGPLFSTLHHISIEMKDGKLPYKFLEEIQTPKTIEDVIEIESYR